MTNPIAFLSYVRNDDAHDNGQITFLRERLQGEITIQTGQSFEIFQDRNDIKWGDNWLDRIEGSLREATFLLPVITPSFFMSNFCRMEFESFVLKERELGLKRLIMPIYYVTTPHLTDAVESGSDNIADELKARNYFDWRDFRFSTRDDIGMRKSVAEMASSIKDAIQDISAEISASEDSATEEVLVPVHPTKESRMQAKTKEHQENYSIFDSSFGSDYKIYTEEFDEIISPTELANLTELATFSKAISSFAEDVADDTSKALLDFAVPVDPEEVAVSLLLDHSGSMRGRPIRDLASSVTLICERLDELSIPFEIIGHTTKSWKGGSSRKKWLDSGRPKQPGRLADLRFIIYKSFDDSWRSSSTTTGLMLKEGILKENIDGEALAFTHQRIANRSEGKKLLFVISDGAPVDDSTLSVNPSRFLEKHLTDVIKRIEEIGRVSIASIGLGHDVSRYYKSAALGTAKSSSDIIKLFAKRISRE